MLQRRPVVLLRCKDTEAGVHVDTVAREHEGPAQLHHEAQAIDG